MNQFFFFFFFFFFFRKEGIQNGEFGTGFNNSCYWFGQVKIIPLFFFFHVAFILAR